MKYTYHNRQRELPAVTLEPKELSWSPSYVDTVPYTQTGTFDQTGILDTLLQYKFLFLFKMNGLISEGKIAF